MIRGIMWCLSTLCGNGTQGNITGYAAGIMVVASSAVTDPAVQPLLFFVPSIDNYKKTTWVHNSKVNDSERLIFNYKSS